MRFFKFDELDSTNNYMKKNIHNFQDYDIVLAKNQTAGRGRQGNTWLSSEGMALFSFLLSKREDKNLNDYMQLPLVVGLSVMEALNFIEENNYMFKWTNDVYLNDKKISGILIEIVENKFIIGIGINVNNEIPENIKDIATALQQKHKIEEVVLAVIDRFQINLAAFFDGRWAELLAKINAKNFLKDKNINIKILDKRIPAKALDIDLDGKLTVQINDEIKKFNIGEIIIEKDKL